MRFPSTAVFFLVHPTEPQEPAWRTDGCILNHPAAPSTANSGNVFPVVDPIHAVPSAELRLLRSSEGLR